MLAAVNLNELIIIEEQQSNPDKVGGYKQTWFSKYVTWAQFKPLYNKKHIGQEVATSKQLQSVNYYEFSIRFREDITNKMRIKCNGKLFSIVKIIDTGLHRRFIEIIAKEIISN